MTKTINNNELIKSLELAVSRFGAKCDIKTQVENKCLYGQITVENNPNAVYFCVEDNASAKFVYGKSPFCACDANALTDSIANLISLSLCTV